MSSCIILSSLLSHASSAHASTFSSTPNVGTLVTNGVVNAITTTGSTTYIGGTFTAVGTASTSYTGFTTSTGTISTSTPAIIGTVSTIIPDGSGGWYVGGTFPVVGTTLRNNLVHILSNGTVDPNFNPNMNNSVLSLALSPDGSTLYAGGRFTTVGGVTYNSLAAINTSNGTAISSFNPNMGSTVNTLALSGTSTLYAGGNFTTVGGVTYNRLAAINTATASATPAFKPNVSGGTVNTLALSGTSTLYAGGTFTTVGGVTYNRLAAINTATASATPAFNPNMSSTVNTVALSPDGSTLYVGEAINIINATTRNYLAAITANGTVLSSFNPNMGSNVNALALSPDGSTLYAGGTFTTVGGVTYNRLAAINTSNSTAISSFNPNMGSTVSALALSPDGSTLYAGGSFTLVGGVSYNNLAAINTSNGTAISSFNPNMGSTVNTLALSGTSTLYAGGTFTTVGGVTYNRLAAINTATASATPAFNPNMSSTVNTVALSPDGSTLYAGGRFTTVGGVAYNQFAAINTATASATPAFRPSVNLTGPSALALSPDGSSIYIGGSFNTVGGVTYNNLAAINTASGTAISAFNPNVNGQVFAVAISSDGSTLYAGGNFSAVGTNPLPYFAVFSQGITTPTATTSAATSVTAVTAIFNGSITATGGSSITQSGFAYGTSSTLSTVIATTTLGTQPGIGTFSQNVSGLSPSTIYYFRAYAVNAVGTSTGTILSTTTLAVVPPTVTTQTATSITSATAIGNGTITATGNENSTIVGMVYGTTTAYGATSTTGGSFSAGSFITSMIGLTCNTTYDAAAYATNGSYTSYGSNIQFTTGACVNSIPTSSDEFVGPFSSWINVKTAYGAVGDGVTDDTAAIQNALNALGTSVSSSTSPVLYFPAGTYKITSTLTLAHINDATIIGQDPLLVNIIWAGAAGGTMLDLNGVAYSKFSRLTFNGVGNALVDVDQSYNNSGKYFDTMNEYSDDYFINAGFGLHGGFLGHGFAETSVERSHFANDSVAGIATGNYNALDLWVRYSTFVNCTTGVTNDAPGYSGAGGFNVYNSIFASSSLADIYIGSISSNFSIRNNYSSGSNYFFFQGGAGGSPSPTDIVDNTILDPTNINGTAISITDQGPTLVMGNVIRTNSVSVGPVIAWESATDDDMESIDNTYTNNNIIASGTNLIETGDQVVSYGSVNPTAPVLPGTLPNLNRQDFEVTPGSNATAIQSVINAAYAQNGHRPIVHIPYGSYSINQTLVVPASDIQIVGDGHILSNYDGTQLNWTGSGSGPVLRLDGPSKITLSDLTVGAGTQAQGISMDNVDQTGSRVYIDQAVLSGYSNVTQPALFVDGLDNTIVEMENNYITGPISVTGGPLSASGIITPATVDIFAGQGGPASNVPSFLNVTSGGKLFVEDLWDDAGNGTSTVFADISGRAEFTADSIVSYQSGGIPSFNIANLNGTTTILSSVLGTSGQENEGVNISGNGASSSILGMGVAMGDTRSYFTDTSSPSSTVAMLNFREGTTTDSDIASVAVPNIGSVNPAFITAMLAQTQSQQPQVLSSSASGISDIRLFRVEASGMNDITLQGDPVSVSVIVPVASSTVSGSAVTLTATTTDTSGGVTGVQFMFDGVTNIGSLITATSSPNTYTTTWNTTAVSNGSHTIYAVASDSLGNYATSTIPVTVSNSGTSSPSVTTSAATLASTSTITLNGSITATGGASSTAEGFIYGTSSALTTNTATTTQYGTFGVGSFSTTTVNLAPNTTYYFEAYAVNSAGTSTGSILSTTTLPWSTPGAPTSVSAATSSPNQATVSFTAPANNGGSTILCLLDKTRIVLMRSPKSK